jgi:hypothetical protein
MKLPKLPLGMLVKLAYWELRERAKYNRKRFMLFILGVSLGTGLGYSATWVAITGDIWWFPWEEHVYTVVSNEGALIVNK